MHAHADPLLNPETSLVVLIDYQAEMFARVKSMDTKLLELNAQAVARACRKFGVPAILSTVGVGMGVNKPTIASLRSELEGQAELDRSSMNAWEDEGVRRAVEKSGRRRVIFGALWTEVCLALPVVQAQREGYETYFVADAVGGTSAVDHEMGIRRMIQAGSKPLTVTTLLCEWTRDWKGPHAGSLREIMRWYFGEVERLAKQHVREPA